MIKSLWILSKESESGSLKPKIPVSVTSTIASGRPVRLEIKDRDSNIVTIESEYLVEKAEKQPTSKVQIEKQLSKLGNTLFEAAELHVNMDGDIFIPMGQLNELRTKAIQQLEKLRISRWKLKPLNTPQLPEPGEKEGQKIEENVSENLPMRPILSVSVYSLEGLEGALSGGADCIYFGEGFFRRPETAGQKKALQRISTLFLKKLLLKRGMQAGKSISAPQRS